MTGRVPLGLIAGALVLLAGRSTQAQAPAAGQPPAQAPPRYPTVSVGVLSYLQYSAELEQRDGFNAFDITRGYININGTLARNIRFRITPDLRRVTDGSLAGSLTFRLKYGFIQFDNVGRPGARLRFGLHQTPWLDFEENINRYRLQGQMFSEREGLVPGSGDFGVGYFAPFPRDYGELEFGVYNGEGFTQSEINKYKSVQARVTVRPFPRHPVAKGLRLSAFYDRGAYAAGQPRRHAIVMSSYERDQVVATAQWLTATERPSLILPRDLDRDGYSLFLEVRQGLKGWAGIVRLDRFDPDQDLADNERRRLIAGVAYWLDWSNARIGLLLNDEDVSYKRGAGRPNENRLLVQMHVQF